MAVIRVNGKRTVVCGGCGDAPEWTWATHPVCRRCWRWQMGQMRLRQEGRGGQRARLRAFLLERDGAVCRYCGDTEAELTLDHIIPKSRGGMATPWNACLACRPSAASAAGAGGGAMTFAYADPPYAGQAQRHYDPQCAEVDHAELIGRLCQDYPDGWALSCASTLKSLRAILPHCPDDARVAAWVKPFCSFKPNVNPAYAWEPVIFCGGRKRNREEPTVRDWVAANITLQRGLSGAKPDEFSVWLFHLLGMKPGDTLDDLFPGTKAISSAWERFSGSYREPLSLDLFAFAEVTQ